MKVQEGGNFNMESFMTGIYGIVQMIEPYVYILVAIALIVDGVLYIIPSEKTKQLATASLPFVALGSGIVILAEKIAQEVTSKFVF